jgi:hypothetical protein
MGVQTRIAGFPPARLASSAGSAHVQVFLRMVRLLSATGCRRMLSRGIATGCNHD